MKTILTPCPTTNRTQSAARRRFGALDRLYGPESAAHLHGARIAVVGLGGVGSWTAEALARCGIGHLTLIDLDHIAESNLNRQIHALENTLGQAKVQAMAQRIAAINPACEVQAIDDFLTPDTAVQYLAANLDVIADCTDQISAKVAMALLARERHQPLVVCGAAGGKTDPLALRAGDLAQASHDALLSKLRTVLRKQHGYPRPTNRTDKPVKRAARKPPDMGIHALWVEQQTLLPSHWQTAQPAVPDANAPAPQGLSCAGYGSVVMVTAAMGMAAASAALRLVLAKRPTGAKPARVTASPQ